MHRALYPDLARSGYNVDLFENYRILMLQRLPGSPTELRALNQRLLLQLFDAIGYLPAEKHAKFAKCAYFLISINSMVSSKQRT